MSERRYVSAQSHIRNELAATIEALQDSSRELDRVVEVARLLDATFLKGGSVHVAGNGGSFSQASHFAAEFVGRYSSDRRGFPIRVLQCDQTYLTAWSNDYSFDTALEREIQTFCRRGDLFIGISTGGGVIDSGPSRNIALAIRAARAGGLMTVGLAGKSGGELAANAELSIVVPSDSTARVQEVHGVLLHLIVEAFELMSQTRFRE